MVKKKDLLWSLAYPLYQILRTLRHEGSHTLAAWLEGVNVEMIFFGRRSAGILEFGGAM